MCSRYILVPAARVLVGQDHFTIVINCGCRSTLLPVQLAAMAKEPIWRMTVDV